MTRKYYELVTNKHIDNKNVQNPSSSVWHIEFKSPPFSQDDMITSKKSARNWTLGEPKANLHSLMHVDWD
jgi:hypothetical protein